MWLFACQLIFLLKQCNLDSEVTTLSGSDTWSMVQMPKRGHLNRRLKTKLFTLSSNTTNTDWNRRQQSGSSKTKNSTTAPLSVACARMMRDRIMRDEPRIFVCLSVFICVIIQWIFREILLCGSHRMTFKKNVVRGKMHESLGGNWPYPWCGWYACLVSKCLSFRTIERTSSLRRGNTFCGVYDFCLVDKPYI